MTLFRAYALDINGYTSYNVLSMLPCSLLTYNGYYGKIKPAKGDNHAAYGTTTTRRVADCRGNCRKAEGTRAYSALLDTEKAINSLQVWQKTQSQEHRSGEVYREQQDRQGVILPQKTLEPSTGGNLKDGP